MQKNNKKVFEIGAPKTGISSLGHAFKILGFNTAGWNEKLYIQFECGKFDEIFEQIELYDAFVDGPWHDLNVESIDARFPNSKFILLERNRTDWLLSYQKHFFTDDTNLSEINDWYDNKYSNIKEYFSARPDDLLIMNIYEGSGWKQLCEFLRCDEPNRPFPHDNPAPVTRFGIAKKYLKIKSYFLKLYLNRLVGR